MEKKKSYGVLIAGAILLILGIVLALPTITVIKSPLLMAAS